MGIPTGGVQNFRVGTSSNGYQLGGIKFDLRLDSLESMKRQSKELQAVCVRLEKGYGERFFAAGATGFDAWANEANIGVEARFGKIFGPTFAPVADYARRPGWLGWFGPLTPYRSLADAERELRQEIENFLVKLQSGNKPSL